MDFTHLKPKIQPSLAISTLLTTCNPSKTIFISLQQKLTTINPFILGAEQFKTDVGSLEEAKKITRIQRKNIRHLKAYSPKR
ncbi:hypothetical protein [Paenibacillus humicus]|uniref:hypothetical protein n=1 Tax=Paenibacillus humicus TaxID=412861 RepID=UPI003D2E3479